MLRAQPSRSRRYVTAAVTAAAGIAALIVVSPALGATPSTGCWGTCGGDRGPVNGYFTVQGRQVQGFEVELKCLGLQKIKQPYGAPIYEGNLLLVTGVLRLSTLQPGIAITQNGHFAYAGNASRLSGRHSYKVSVKLAGQFVTATKATMALTIDYGQCGTQRIVVHHAP